MPTRLALQVRGHKAGRMKHRTPCRGQKEHQVSVFTVDLKNQPGELARLCEAMAGRGINLILSATARGEEGTVVFIADDEASAETVLQDAGGAAGTVLAASTGRGIVTAAAGRAGAADGPWCPVTAARTARTAAPASTAAAALRRRARARPGTRGSLIRRSGTSGWSR